MPNPTPPLLERNADRSPEDAQRNGNCRPLTNAERQQRYRDRKRGGPPQGRWAGYVTLQRTLGISRSSAHMARWIYRHAPDEYARLCIVMNRLHGSRRKGLGIKPLYRRLRAEITEALTRAVRTPTDEEFHERRRSCRLVPRRQDGRFVFEWIRQDG
jgi:hypothetical protein